MATALLPVTQNHFGGVVGSYATAFYDPLAGQQSTPLTSSANLQGGPAIQQQSNFTSPQRWAAQQAFQRRTSKSPNVRDKTPIRHNRPEMSRHRSTSRPEMLFAYAEEQSRPAQHAQQQTNVRPMFMSSMEASTSPYPPQGYNFTTPSYLQQPSYFDPNTVPQGYAPIPAQTDPNSGASLYTTPRNDLPIPHLGGSTLNPSDTVFTHSRPPQLPSVSSVPSSFPPIPQPLESTPTDVDVVGSRQKPQCWDHGCNGRQFSTFSNLLRHQREKSGTATKARCPHCGTEFTRTTARNGHLYGGKCKGMPDASKDDEDQGKEGVP